MVAMTSRSREGVQHLLGLSIFGPVLDQINNQTKIIYFLVFEPNRKPVQTN